MRILYVITKANRGGAQTNVLALAKGMKELGHEVMVSTGEKGWMTEELDRAGVKVEIVQGLRRSWNPFAILQYIIWLSRESGFDIVHLHSSNAIAGLFGCRKIIKAFDKLRRYFLFPERPCRDGGVEGFVRKIVTIHGWSLLSPGWRGSGLVKLAYRLFMKLALRRADHVVFVCKSDQKFGIEQGLVREGQSEVVYNGVDVNGSSIRYAHSDKKQIFPERLRRYVGGVEGLDPFRVGTLARDTYAKNLDLFRAVANRFDPSEVRFVELTRPDDLFTLDLFLLTSRFEGFPYVLLEAALAGIPIIATNVGGVRELIEHNVTGRLVPSGDADRIEAEIRDSCRLLVTAADYRHRETVIRLAEAAYQKVVTEFTASSMLEATKHIYEQLLA